MNLVSTWPGDRLSGKPTLKRVGGSTRMFGNINRAKPSSHIKCVTASDVKPTASDDPNNTPPAAAKNERRVVAATGVAAARGRAYSGFAGIGGTSIFFFAAGADG